MRPGAEDISPWQSRMLAAKPYVGGKADPLPYMSLSNGWPTVFQKQCFVDCSAMTQQLVRENVELQMRRFGNHSRAIVKVNWVHRWKGHLFIAENIDDAFYFCRPTDR